MSATEQKNQIIKKYKSPFVFYLLSIAIPWVLWFISDI
jgi:hypothetical protein